MQKQSRVAEQTAKEFSAVKNVDTKLIRNRGQLDIVLGKSRIWKSNTDYLRLFTVIEKKYE